MVHTYFLTKWRNFLADENLELYSNSFVFWSYAILELCCGLGIHAAGLVIVDSAEALNRVSMHKGRRGPAWGWPAHEAMWRKVIGYTTNCFHDWFVYENKFLWFTTVYHADIR